MRFPAARRSRDGRPGSRLWPFLLASSGLHAALLLAWQPAPALLSAAPAPLSVSLHFTEPAGREPENAASPATKTPEARPEAEKTEPPEPKRSAPPVAAKSPARNPETQATARTPARAARTKTDVGKTEPPARKRRAAVTAAEESTVRNPEPAATRTPTRAAKTKTAERELPTESKAGVGETAAPHGNSQGDADAAALRYARERVRNALLSDLTRHFEYPWLARRRGWQGMVWLSVTVEPDGRLKRIRVARSSGHDVLDRSAVETLQRVGQVAQARRWLDGQALELPLPIVYRLTD